MLEEMQIKEKMNQLSALRDELWDDVAYYTIYKNSYELEETKTKYIKVQATLEALNWVLGQERLDF